MVAEYDLLRQLRYVRTALYVPASNARALEKASSLDADMLIIDLEDAVSDDEKESARSAVMKFLKTSNEGKLISVRVNSPNSRFFDDDCAALADCDADFFVVPKVESAKAIDHVRQDLKAPLLAMIETPAGLYAAREIAAKRNVAALIAGTNDIAAEGKINPGPQRQGLELSLQMILLASASAGIPAFDGVCNNLDDMAGFEAECLQGYNYGFSGKTIIHPNQITIANNSFSPTDAAIEDAKALLVEAKAGAGRFRGRMIEAMHVEDAKFILERAGHRTAQV